MSETYIPICCTPLNDYWPLQQTLPGVQFLSTHFDPTLLAEDEFLRCGIVPVNGVAKRKTEYLAGRLCAREGIRRITDISSVPGVGADGAPQWPAGIVGSISHSGSWAGALVAQLSAWRSLGLDMEQTMASANAERLAAHILTATELRQLLPLSLAQRARQIGLAFSLKESLFKALYPLVLRRFCFHDAELLSCDKGTARLRLLINLAQDWPAGSELDGQFCELNGYMLSLVSIPA
jgi:enterobactin synthetase component D